MSTRHNPSRRRVRHTIVAVAVGALSALAAPALAAPVAGCASAAAGWNLRSVEQVTRAITGPDNAAYAGLLPVIEGLDRNDDGSLCLAMRWGQHLNPKSHWYPLDLFIVVDNVARAK